MNLAISHYSTSKQMKTVSRKNALIMQMTTSTEWLAKTYTCLTTTETAKTALLINKPLLDLDPRYS